MEVTFLLGSGISKDAGMPSVEKISKQVFENENVIRRSDSAYSIAAPGSPNFEMGRDDARPALDLIERLRSIVDQYFFDFPDDHQVNYEDVANLAKQIADALSGEYENPGLLPLIRELEQDVENLLECATEARNCIRDVVWHILGRPIESTNHLRAITDGCKALGRVDLFELNHDLVLETALRDHGLTASDGFTRRDGDVLFWTDQFEEPIRHFKLHGSIKWFARYVPGEPWQGLVAARSMTNDPNHELDANGEYLELPPEGRPMILAGTFDKPLAYDSMIYADQHYRFHETLRHTDAVVVIGYGFRDKAINTRLIGWLLGSPDRRMVVVHGDMAGLLSGARGAIAGKWGQWVADGRLCLVEAWIAGTVWSEIASALAS